MWKQYVAPQNGRLVIVIVEGQKAMLWYPAAAYRAPDKNWVVQAFDSEEVQILPDDRIVAWCELPDFPLELPPQLEAPDEPEVECYPF